MAPWWPDRHVVEELRSTPRHALGDGLVLIGLPRKKFSDAEKLRARYYSFTGSMRSGNLSAKLMLLLPTKSWSARQPAASSSSEPDHLCCWFGVGKIELEG